MNCLTCGRDAGFNRAVVHVLSGQAVGRLCRNCELTHFGQRLETSAVGRDACTFCDRDGHFALPTFRPCVVEDGGTLVSTTEPAVTDVAPRACDYHVDALERIEDPAAATGEPPDRAGPR